MATTDEIIARTAPSRLIDHNLIDREVESLCDGMVRYEKRPAKRRDGSTAEGLFNAWIVLNNPKQFNSYTTDMVKATILAFRKASVDREVNAVVFTGAGDRAFCTGGNTKEYAEYYSGNPQEYRQYMRLFNDMVSAILGCDKPVICRVNGMRIGGGQEIGMACDFTVAQDLANFGQAGPKHGSAAIGGATDFLPVMIGCEQAMVSGTLCEPFSAHKAARLGIVSGLVPALKVGGTFVANPTVVTDRMLDEYGRIVHGDQGRGGRPLPARPDGRGSLRETDRDVPRVHDQEPRGAPQAEARGVEREQGGCPGVAGAQHDERGPRRFPRLQRGDEGDRARDRLRPIAPGAGEGDPLDRGSGREPDPPGEEVGGERHP
jgi:6-oxo-cyclohex-1-ene-carbonyl-CoA hydrolase